MRNVHLQSSHVFSIIFFLDLSFIEWGYQPGGQRQEYEVLWSQNLKVKGSVDSWCWNDSGVQINGIHLWIYTVIGIFYNYDHQSILVGICHSSRACCVLQTEIWVFYCCTDNAKSWSCFLTMWNYVKVVVSNLVLKFWHKVPESSS